MRLNEGDVARLRVIFAKDPGVLAVVDAYVQAELAHELAADNAGRLYGTTAYPHVRDIKVRRRGRADGLAAALVELTKHHEGAVVGGGVLDVGARVKLPGNVTGEVLDLSVRSSPFDLFEVTFKAVLVR